MSDVQITEKPKLRGWPKALLIGSLTLNLLVLGVVVGGVLGHDRRPPRVGDVNIGALSAALSQDEREALRHAAEARGGSFRAMRAQDRADRAALVAALGAEPFDPAAFDAVMARQRTRMLERIDIGAELMRERVLGMSPEARKAFADRLAHGEKRFGPPEGGKFGPPRD
jgi:uncharacterized membrane protein